MNTLQVELRRLYLPENPPSDGVDPANDEPDLIDSNGCVRAMVLEVAQVAGCNGVTALWHGVQDELELPTPAMAISGISAYQVWFSLREPVPVAQAMVFLEALRLRYLGDAAPRHVVMRPFTDASGQTHHSKLVPALQIETGHWSAFVAPGLISMFADEPWLDLPPSPEAQAKLLANFESITPAAFQRTQERLRPAHAAAAPEAQATPADTTGPAKAHEGADPKGFLLSVMNDPDMDVSLRIEAAKALLPYYEALCRSGSQRAEVSPATTGGDRR
ncbi:hypothetical protein HUU62_02740 [Rhodoferax sp. 4810]|nr:hypothetical protein [Rhodoferax jenense]